MRGLFRTLLIAFGLVELYWLLPPRFEARPEDTALNRIGAIHVRSAQPLTTQSIGNLAARARQSGIHFIVIADPRSSHARSYGLEGTYEGVDVYVELEAHLTAGHAVVFYSHTAARELSDEALSRAAWRHFLGTDPRPGMFLVTAHPDSKTVPWNRLDKFSEGMELVNLDTLWRNQLESGPMSLVLSSLIFPFSNYLSALRVIHVPEKNLQSWDAMNSIAPGRMAIAAQEIPAGSLIPGWSSDWNFASALIPAALNSVRLSAAPAADFEARKLQTYEALARGRTALFFPLRYARFGVDWRLDCPERNYRSGDNVPSALSNCVFKIEMESGLAAIKPSVALLRDGKVVKEWPKASATLLEHNLPSESGGSYRLELSVPTRTPSGLLLNKPVPYVFYNPIYVR
jgi:hypothetical protein